MATPSQIYANARNAKRSTGPKTPEDKAKSSKNALKHGLRSEEIVLRSLEFDEDWDAHLQSYIEDAQPVGDVEYKLAEKAAMCLWKQSRAAMMLALAQDTQVEHKAANLIGVREGRKIDIDDRPAIAQKLKSLKCFGLQEPGFDREAAREAWLRIDLTEPQIEAYFRYYNSFERGFFRAYRELEKRRIERKNDAHRAERLELERKKLSMRAPSTPTFGMLVDEFKTKYDDDDLEFLLGSKGLLDGEKRQAAMQIQKDRQLEKALAEHRTKKRAEAELLAQAQAASEPEEEYDWDSAQPWDKRHNLVYRDTDDAYVRENSHLHKEDSNFEDPPAAEKLGSNGNGAQYSCESVIDSDSRRGETPVTPSESDSRRGETPVTPSESDSCRGETPATPSESDSRRGETPVTPSESDSCRGETPVTPSESDSCRGETPVTPSESDSCRGETPVTPSESDSCRGETPVTPASYGENLQNPGGRIGGSAPTLIDSGPDWGETPVTPSDSDQELGSNGQGTQFSCGSVLASQSRRGETPVTPASSGKGLQNPGGRIGGSAPTLIDSGPHRGETPVTPSESNSRRGETPVTPTGSYQELGSNGQGTQFSCESVTYVEPIVSENALASPGEGNPINNHTSEPELSPGQSA